MLFDSVLTYFLLILIALLKTEKKKKWFGTEKGNVLKAVDNAELQISIYIRKYFMYQDLTVQSFT